jgi:hypothetical protein
MVCTPAGRQRVQNETFALGGLTEYGRSGKKCAVGEGFVTPPTTESAKPGERLAYDKTHVENGATYRALAFYNEGHKYARIVISRNGEVLVENENYPAYKIYNVSAHLSAIAARHERILSGKVVGDNGVW